MFNALSVRPSRVSWDLGMLGKMENQSIFVQDYPRWQYKKSGWAIFFSIFENFKPSICLQCIQAMELGFSNFDTLLWMNLHFVHSINWNLQLMECCWITLENYFFTLGNLDMLFYLSHPETSPSPACCPFKQGQEFNQKVTSVSSSSMSWFFSYSLATPSISASTCKAIIFMLRFGRWACLAVSEWVMSIGKSNHQSLVWSFSVGCNVNYNFFLKYKMQPHLNLIKLLFFVCIKRPTVWFLKGSVMRRDK